MDKIIKKIIEKIESSGYVAYIVGGYVRDLLLGNTTYDVDICTNALPKDIHKIFNINNANNYGGSNLKCEKLNIDITTFREEIKYVDRKPVEIKYINDLKLDLERRDFTINAICMDKNGKIIDYVGGVDDLNKHILKSIGSADYKLKEDPLRILRAIRFATILDFDIDPELTYALKENAQLVKTLSGVRIKQEFSKIFMSKNYLKALSLFKEFKIDEYLGIHYDSINYTSDLLGMWAQITIKDIPFTKEEKKSIIKIKDILDKGSIDNMTIYKNGLYISEIAADILNIKKDTITNMYNNLQVKVRKDIAITSNDIISILDLKQKSLLNIIYEKIEEAILNGNLENNKEEIKKFLLKEKG